MTRADSPQKPFRDQSPKDIASKIEKGDRSALAQAITLVESTLERDRNRAMEVVRRCYANRDRGGALRIGISGVPGVGKSTLIENLGKRMCDVGHRVAVLTIDPSSSLTGGSVLGDKTRMSGLSQRESAFVRTSPARGNLGGVTATCWESVQLCELAGYDRIIIETVGVGQSEVGVRSVVDFFLLLQLAGAGDEIQGVKKGIIEMADGIVVTKADGDNEMPATLAAEETRSLSRILRPYNPHWAPRVSTCSALTGFGVGNILDWFDSFLGDMTEGGQLDVVRRQQEVEWFRGMVEKGIVKRVWSEPDLIREFGTLESDIRSAAITPLEAAERFLSRLKAPAFGARQE